MSEKVRHKDVSKCVRSRLHVYPQRPASSCFHNMLYYQETWHCGQKRKLDRSWSRERLLHRGRELLDRLLRTFILTFRDNTLQFNKHWLLVWTEAHVICFLQEHTLKRQSHSWKKRPSFLIHGGRLSAISGFLLRIWILKVFHKSMLNLLKESWASTAGHVCWWRRSTRQTMSPDLNPFKLWKCERRNCKYLESSAHRGGDQTATREVQGTHALK